MRERGGKVRAIVIKSAYKRHYVAIFNQKSTVITDDFDAYLGLEGFNHKSVNKEFVNGIAHTNGIENVWATFKRGCHGSFHNIRHLRRYMSEFVFRLNEGGCRVDTKDGIVPKRHR